MGNMCSQCSKLYPVNDISGKTITSIYSMHLESYPAHDFLSSIIFLDYFMFAVLLSNFGLFCTKSAVNYLFLGQLVESSIHKSFSLAYLQTQLQLVVFIKIFDIMHPQVKNYIFKVLSQKRRQEKLSEKSQIIMNPSNTVNKSLSSHEQILCIKHANSNIQFICAVPNCKQNRKMCELCKQKQSLHISYHSNYIFKLKQFLDFNQSKLVIPKLQKGLQDLETFISKHKQFYKQQMQKITIDFDQIVRNFIETSNQYKKIYLQNFQKQINSFDNEFLQIVNNLKTYSNEKNHQESFFTKLFANDKNTNDIEEIVHKNSKGFDVRASIITLKSKLTNSKVGKTIYKHSEAEQLKFNELLGYLDSFCGTFYDKFKDLLACNNQNNPHSPQKNNLKTSIVSQTKSLSTSRVSSQAFDTIESNFLKKSSTNQKQLVKCTLPEMDPTVSQVRKFLKPFPNFTQSNLKEEGPYKYQTGTYLGNYENGLRSGKGIFIFDDGSYYQGSWEKDNMAGYGRLIKPNSYYQGDIKDGFAHGKGNYEDVHKLYAGEWRNDLRHGIGEEQIKGKQRKYTGSFLNDKYDGRGKLIDKDFIYEGQFKIGLFDGEGLIKYKNGQIFKGSFRQNQRVFGRHSFPDGSYYEGSFRDNMPHGSGQFYWPDGIKYSGQWKTGLQEGIGIQTLANGKQLKGFWQNGTWIKWI